MKKILIAERIDEKVLREFQTPPAIEFIYQPDISVSNLAIEISKYDGLIVRPKPVDENVINNAAKLKLIIRGGAGVNSIALEACRQKGIIVENTPGLNSDATAEFTVLLMLQAYAKRYLELSNQRGRDGDPGNPRDYIGSELNGKKLGLVGLGNIGARVAKIATAFGMEVSAYVRNKKDFPYPQITALTEFLKQGHDIISLHIPLTTATTNLISDNEFALMKLGTVIINTARPQLINVEALGKALATNKISSFAIDGDYDLIKPFIEIDKNQKGLITHHIADTTFEAQANITRQALYQALEFFINGKEINRIV